MSLLQAHRLEKYIGSQMILEDVSLTIGRGERVGLIGRNGCGKSTLLRLLSGVDRPDSGIVDRTARSLKIGCLPQYPEFEPGQNVLEAVLPDPSEIPRWQAIKVLGGLGLGGREEQEAATLSGGEKTRLMLARLLLSDADLLLLDEPTNHLDIRMMEWLEGFLEIFPGAVLVVSHDRRFLDRAVRRILELERGRLTEYAGNYSFYAEAKRQTLLRQEEDYLLQQKQIRSLQEFVRRQLQAASRIQDGPKRGRDFYGQVAEKAARRAKVAQRRIERMEKVEKMREDQNIEAAFRPSARGGQIVYECRRLTQRFGGRTLFHDLDMTITYGERVGIIGPNGSGKTTLLRLLMGQVQASGGEVKAGVGLVPVYLAQEQENLDWQSTVLDEILKMGGLDHTEARTLLACLLFRQEDVFKEVRHLSVGERVRLALARAMVSGANLMVLDEPTNHLDIASRERMEEALQSYAGTLLVVSHDRYLLGRLADSLVILGEDQARLYPGPYSEWE
ncbi:MAG: ABC-F type ribosomal protection protein, partial [Armatimonadetes bacterium]|nr:ABC-F type ribosomal protection protein [Armatimonadota bacterium]